MEGMWWTEMSSGVKRPKLDAQTDQENYLKTNTSIQNSHNVRRHPLGEISESKLNIQLSGGPVSSEGHRGNLKKANGKDQFQRTTNISIRNERERNRVKLLNLGFERLRSVVPRHAGEQLSKISTLKKAIWYIEHLDRVLHGQEASAPLLLATPDTTATETLQSSDSSSGSRISQPALTRDPRVLTCQQTNRHEDSREPLSARGAGSLPPGTTSWTPLPPGPASSQGGETTGRHGDKNNSNGNGKSSDQYSAKAMGGSVSQQGHLSPIFPKQWDTNNNDCQTSPKLSNLFKSQWMTSGNNEDSKSMHWSSVDSLNRVYLGRNATNHYTVLR